LPEYRTYETERGVGRPMEFPERLTLPLPKGMTARLDASRQDGESRLDVIRSAVERELKRRERQKDKPG